APAPEIDGRLDDAAWQSAVWTSGFVQKDPAEGAPAQTATEVAFMYDEEALYVAARMTSLGPDDIDALVSRRDNSGRSERIVFSFDSYHDRRTAYSFGITASGVRFDYYHGSDNEYNRDYSWDPVWEAKVETGSAGWTAELRIPFSQFRFNPTDVQVWGLNMNRYIPSRNEDDYWVLVPKNATGWSSRMAELTGIRGVRPSRRIEVTPYVATSSRITGDGDLGNPFDDGSNLEARAGGDFKMGLGPNLTLDATVNPDFGQVEADPAEVNLSAVETVFSERRPFFTEGSQLLQGNGPQYFYSRRIGGPPRGNVDGAFDFVDRPQAATILGAAKITGRLPSGLSVGGLAAVTDREDAQTFRIDGGVRERIQIAPVTGFGVLRLQQEFGRSASTVGISATGLRRDVEAGTPLGNLLVRDAYAGGVDWTLRFGNGDYILGGSAGLSHVAGDAAAIALVQQSSAHYLQRPDQDHVSFDPTRTALTGYMGGLFFEKNSGRHWLYSAELFAESPLFEINDVGRIGTADDIDGFASLRYRENQPSGPFQNYQLAMYGFSGWNFGGILQNQGVDFEANATLRNFWQAGASVEIFPGTLSDNLTRGGPLMRDTDDWNVNFNVQSPFSSVLQLQLNALFLREELDGRLTRLQGTIGVRPNGRWQLEVSPSIEWAENPRQYVATRDGGPAATYGGRYVFARIERRTVAAQVRFSYAFTPDLTLELYGEPFAASGEYSELGELAAARTNDLRTYGTDGTTITRTSDFTYEITDAGNGQTFEIPRPDFRVLSFRSNAVVRWEWRPGSTFFLVWQQDRSGFEPGGRIGGGSLWDAVRSAGDHFLALKVSYWLPIN
ncbi:MAG: carbohydrate binding family 9 domain-containing protein, partial [Gemmatimonadota bacterium]|nr:carbohydrate binding family 9 domain-containing protein [Gemmatimonadota bacterium]